MASEELTESDLALNVEISLYRLIVTLPSHSTDLRGINYITVFDYGSYGLTDVVEIHPLAQSWSIASIQFLSRLDIARRGHGDNGKLCPSITYDDSIPILVPLNPACSVDSDDILESLTMVDEQSGPFPDHRIPKTEYSKIC